MRVDYKIILFSVLPWILFSCSSSNSQIKDKIDYVKKIDTIITLPLAIEVKEKIIEPDSVYDDFAKLVCGKLQAPWAIKVDTATYLRFSKSLDKKMSDIEKKRLLPLKEWNAANIRRYGKSESTSVFYPFSGGDFLHLYWLYPKGNNYLMMAREKVGEIPDLSNFNKKQIQEYVEAVDYILRDIYSKSYFITKNMMTDTKHGSVVSGMLPVLLWSVARTGHDVVNVEKVDLDSTGNLFYSRLSPQDPTSKAVRITFMDQGSKKVKTLTYFSCDISDNGIKRDIGLRAYLMNLSQSNTFVKSASYLMHYGTFSEIRNIILDKSNFYVQDDTGVPFRYIDQEKFNIELYGTYKKPVIDFSKNLLQKDLMTAYQSEYYYKGKLNFSLGYHWGSGNQNQMVVVKKRGIWHSYKVTM